MAEARQPVTCARCGFTFVPDWSEADAMAEMERNLASQEDPQPVCDDCYAEFLEWAKVHAPEALTEHGRTL